MAIWQKEAQALREEKQRLLERLGEKPEQSGIIAYRDSVTDLSFTDNHPADQGTETFERSKDLSLREHHLIRYRLVEEALGRIDAGVYGICRRCGSSIDPARLEAVPETPFCLPCQQDEESMTLSPNRRPVEEDRLTPPFAQRYIAEDPGMDQEDFWQEAARHNKRPHIFEDFLEDEDSGLVDNPDSVSNEQYREQLRE